MTQLKADIEKVLQVYVTKTVSDAVKNTIEQAKEDVEKAILSKIDNLALNILRHYDIQEQMDRIIITVRKDI